MSCAINYYYSLFPVAKLEFGDGKLSALSRMKMHVVEPEAQWLQLQMRCYPNSQPQCSVQFIPVCIYIHLKLCAHNELEKNAV